MARLTYFDFPGSRGEECRLALHVAGVDFHDQRLSREQWMERKATTPFGGLPIYEEDGKVLSQSNAILGYIGRGHGLHPTDPWEAAKHDSVLAAAEHLRHATPSGRGVSEEEKKAQRVAFATGPYTQWAASLESMIRGPFLGGAALNVADLKLFVLVGAYLAGTIDHVGPEYLEPFPKLRGLVAAVRADDRVKRWYAK